MTQPALEASESERETQPPVGTFTEFGLTATSEERPRERNVVAADHLEFVDRERRTRRQPLEERRPRRFVVGQTAYSPFGRWHIEHDDVVGVRGDHSFQIAPDDRSVPVADHTTDIGMVVRRGRHGVSSVAASPVVGSIGNETC